MDTEALTSLTAGTPIIVGGDRVVRVDDELAAAFRPGDALLPLATGEVLHVPAADRKAAAEAIDAADAAFAAMGSVSEEQLDTFYGAFADRLADDDTFAAIAAANAADVADAQRRGRSTTRLELTAAMREAMIDGLRGWSVRPSPRGHVQRTLEHQGWRLEEVVDRLGVVAFVFEGRPNVFADACGVLRGGNSVVFRIGSDALATARAVVTHALQPALAEAGLPAGAVSLVDAPSHAAGWALFSDPRLALAVARGSGPAVRQLGAIAQQAGNTVSAHGTGGAWMVAADTADGERFAAAVRASLDRKVCNTLNTCVIVRRRADDLVDTFLDALTTAAEDLGTEPKLHVVDGSQSAVDPAWFTRRAPIVRAEGVVEEVQADVVDEAALATEWEWEASPEVTLVVVDDIAEAVGLFNRYSPRFILSVISEDEADHELAWEAAEAPYVCDGFTRWVDGQYALGTPELGLSNWELGRLLGRTGILSGDAIRSVRVRVRQSDPYVRR